MGYDIIGDIHGHATALERLLRAMGYASRNGAWRCTGRTAVFLGDFVDRGPEQMEAINLVRSMVDAGSAQAVMGNHDFNAIAWYLEDPEHQGEFLRPHRSTKYGDKNYRQHRRFLEAIGDDFALHGEIVEWFLSLPLWLDLRGIRVVHACWHERFMEYLDGRLAAGNRLDRRLMVEASREPGDEAEKDNPDPTVFKAVEVLLKGLEIPLPPGLGFSDSDGTRRTRVRVRWWDPDGTTYRTGTLPGAGLDPSTLPP